MRTEINAASFSAPETEKLFRDFIDWLTNVVGPEKSAQTQNRYAEFFKAIQYAPVNWQSDVFFLARIDGGFLRKSSKPRLYLESIGVRFDASALKDAMDLRTINNNLMSIRENCGDEYRAQVGSFFDNRLKEYRDGKTKMLTTRIESSAVMKLFEYATRLDNIHKGLKALAITSPGLRCSLLSFLCHLSGGNNLQLAFPEINFELRLAHLLKQSNSRLNDSPYFLEYISVCLNVFHFLDELQINEEQVFAVNDGFNVRFQNKLYWVPRPHKYPIN